LQVRFLSHLPRQTWNSSPLRGGLTTATVIMAVMTLGLTALASAVSGLALDGGNLAAASLSLIPLGLLMAAVGYLLSGWVRTA